MISQGNLICHSQARLGAHLDLTIGITSSYRPVIRNVCVKVWDDETTKAGPDKYRLTERGKEWRGDSVSKYCNEKRK